ncbi:MAG: tetratricopeptide repeat protein [Candidatus Bathyarchaeota archaeon]|nr:tetratricopeptide repeat protein [Candidatus Bathyarchaeota archaeon]
MSEKNVREDPIKMHKDASALMENGKYVEARDMFIRTGELYYKGQNYFGSSEMYYKAGESSFALKEYEKAIELFTKSSDIAFSKGFDRYGVSALEQARDCQKALGNTKEVEEINKKIAEINKKNEEPEGEPAFSLFS